ncbi:uncharacterized mitochondrial protein-like protein [Tanacetum coccineum]
MNSTLPKLLLWRIYLICSNALVEPSSEQSNVVNHSETEITSDSNIIPYSQYLIESQQATVQNSTSSVQQDKLILSVIEQLNTQVANCTKINLENTSVNDTLTAELKRYKEYVKNSVNSPEPILSSRPTIVEVPKELPKVSLVNTSLKKLKHHLTGFDVVGTKNNLRDSKVSDVPIYPLDECWSSKFSPVFVKFGNDHVAKILGYGDYQIGNVTISKVYYVEGLGHNLFSVGQFCDSNLEDAFRQHTYFIRNLEGVDLLTGSRGNNLFPKLKFEKDHLCSACAMGKSKKKPHKPKSEDTNQEKLYLLHMDLGGPMRVASVNGKKYILVIVDDYSRFTWVKFLRSKDEAPDFIIKRLDISHETSVAALFTAKCFVNLTKSYLIEVCRRPMLIYAKAPLIFMVQNPDAIAMLNPKSVSIKRLRHGKTPYELLHDKPPDIVEVVLQFPLYQPDHLPQQQVDQEAPSLSNSQQHLKHHLPSFLTLFKIDNPDLKLNIWVMIRTLVSKFQKSLMVNLHRQILFIQLLHRASSFSVLIHAFLTAVEPKTYKDALTQSCWIEAMQEELNEFERFELDELGGILKNKARLVARGYRQEEGIDFEESFSLKYGFDSCDPVDTPMVEKSKLDEDKEGKSVDPTHYRGMIGTLLYLIASTPDLQFAICMCARYQARPTQKHLHAVKRMFRYLKGTVNRGLWYPKDSSIALTAFADADHAGCQYTRCSTSGSMQFLGDRLVSWSKHIDIRFQFIKVHVENGVIELYFVNTEYQLADIFKKALARERIEFLINKLGMRSFTPGTLKQLADEVDE